MNDDIRELLRDIRSWFSYYDRTLVAKNLRDRIDAALEGRPVVAPPADARAKALEEAAKICDQIARPEGKRHPTKGYYVDDGVGCADAIRAAITGKAAKREA